MLKKVLLLLMAVMLLTGAATAFAEGLDLSNLTFEELTELRTKINLEMQTRPEAEEIILSNGGTFIVGQDLQSGTYDFIHHDSISGGALVQVYEDETKSRMLYQVFVSSESYTVYTLPDLQEGNCITVGFTIKLSKVGFPAYNPPEGTVVLQGAYEVGKEIPAGKYSIHESTKGSRVRVYKDLEQYQSGQKWTAQTDLSLDASTLSGVVTLTEGQIFVVEKNDIVMNKYTTTFTFD